MRRSDPPAALNSGWTVNPARCEQLARLRSTWEIHTHRPRQEQKVFIFYNNDSKHVVLRQRPHYQIQSLLFHHRQISLVCPEFLTIVKLGSLKITARPPRLRDTHMEAIAALSLTAGLIGRDHRLRRKRRHLCGLETWSRRVNSELDLLDLY